MMIVPSSFIRFWGGAMDSRLTITGEHPVHLGLFAILRLLLHQGQECGFKNTGLGVQHPFPTLGLQMSQEELDLRVFD